MFSFKKQKQGILNYSNQILAKLRPFNKTGIHCNFNFAFLVAFFSLFSKKIVFYLWNLISVGSEAVVAEQGGFERLVEVIRKEFGHVVQELNFRESTCERLK